MKRFLVFGLLLCLGCAARSIQPVDQTRSLADLCESYKSDKCAWHHNYVELYETFFSPLRDEVERIFEIGVAEGYSLQLWEDYFPNATVFGIDIVDSSSIDTDRIKTFVADQSSREQLGAFLAAHGSDFDIILDDGGHAMNMQQISFGYLFPHLKPGGLYVIEDIHTSFPSRYSDRYGARADESNTTFTMIVNFIRDSQFRSEYLTAQEMRYLTENVEYCGYLYRVNKPHSDFFICKKKEKPAEE